MASEKNIADLKVGDVIFGYTLQGPTAHDSTGITWPAKRQDGQIVSLQLFESSTPPRNVLGIPLMDVVEELSSDVIADVLHKVTICMSRLHAEQVFLRNLNLEGILVDGIPDGLDEPRVQLLHEQGESETEGATDEQPQLGWALYRLLTGTPESADPDARKHPFEPRPALLEDPYVTGFDPIIEKCLETDPLDRFKSTEALAGAFASLRRAIARMRFRPEEAKTAFTAPAAREWLHGTGPQDDDTEEEATTALELKTGALIEGHRLVKMRHRVSTGELWDTYDESSGSPRMLMMSLTSFAGQPLMDDVIANELIGRIERRIDLQDPGLIRILEVRQQDGRDFVVSLIEPFHGTPFSQVLESIDTSTIAQVFERACSTLTYMHAQNHLHRGFGINSLFISDPENDERTIKLLDSELAPVVETEEDSLIAMVRRLPPEALARLEGKKVSITGAGDQWCVGLTLYEVLTGRPPFNQTEGPELMLAIMDDPPPPLEVKPRFRSQPYVQDLTEITLRCLQKEPSERFPSMGELASAFLKLTSS